MIREMLGIAEGILQDLHNEHSEIDGLLANITDCNHRAERDRQFSELKIKLLTHLKAEEEVGLTHKSIETANFFDGNNLIKQVEGFF